MLAAEARAAAAAAQHHLYDDNMLDTPSSEQDIETDAACLFCGGGEEDAPRCGHLRPAGAAGGGGCVHHWCALWAPSVYQREVRGQGRCELVAGAEPPSSSQLQQGTPPDRPPSSSPTSRNPCPSGRVPAPTWAWRASYCARKRWPAHSAAARVPPSPAHTPGADGWNQPPLFPCWVRHAAASVSPLPLLLSLQLPAGLPPALCPARSAGAAGDGGIRALVPGPCGPRGW